MGAWRMRPPIVEQPDDFTKCWAAVFESFSQVTPPYKKITIDEIIDRFTKRPGRRVRPNGNLRLPSGLLEFERDFSLDFRIDIDSKDFTTEFLQPLVSKSHVMLYLLSWVPIPDLPDGSRGRRVWHTVLVYGADKFSYCVMDPLVPGIYLTHKFALPIGSKYHVVWKP